MSHSGISWLLYINDGNMENLIYSDHTYEIIGLCYEVHNNLGPGFLEIVYKDALELEFKRAGIPYTREKKYEVNYKGVILPHHFYADFVVYNKIILEAKAVAHMPEKFVAMAINYLKVSNNKLALLVNFGEAKLEYKRLILEKKIEEWKRDR
jgi:GxxExxY protein